MVPHCQQDVRCNQAAQSSQRNGGCTLAPRFAGRLCNISIEGDVGTSNINRRAWVDHHDVCIQSFDGRKIWIGNGNGGGGGGCKAQADVMALLLSFYRRV